MKIMKGFSAMDNQRIKEYTKDKCFLKKTISVMKRLLIF